jgi:hypothetical protein
MAAVEIVEWTAECLLPIDAENDRAKFVDVLRPGRPEPSQRPPVARDKTPAFNEARAAGRDIGKV